MAVRLSDKDRYDWVAKTLGFTFVYPNSWIEDGDFRTDGLHLNRRGARLGHIYCRKFYLQRQGIGRRK